MTSEHGAGPVTMDADAQGLATAAAVLRSGGVVLVPTDTTYGLAALATDPDAIAQLFVLKRRPADRSIAVLAASIDQAERLAELTPAEREVACAFWPGALTLVLRRRVDAPAMLGKDDGTIAIRLPADPFVAQLTAEVGPLATTSANLSGEPPATRPGRAAASLDGDVGLIIDDGDRSHVASTVAGIDPTGEITVFRAGAISADELGQAVGAVLGRLHSAADSDHRANKTENNSGRNVDRG